MADITYTVLVDWDNDGDYGDTGEDISARVLEAKWFRGRDDESQLTGRSVAGACELLLNNASGDYSRHNTSSPLTGLLLPGRSIQIQAGSADFPYEFPIVFNDNVVWTGTLLRLETIVDAINPGQFARLVGVGPLGLINERVVRLAMQTSILTGALWDAILDEIGWPSGDRNTDTGQTTITRYWTGEIRGLTALQQVEASEGGFGWEGKKGEINFSNRHARLAGNALVSQATFSDASGAALSYSAIREGDPLPGLFNIFSVPVQRYTVGSLATLWTLSESGANSPSIKPGDTKTFWARYPNPDSGTDAVAVDAWTTLVENTDYEANTESGGGGTDRSASLSLVLTKFATAMKIAITNDHATDTVFITLLQARGTPVTADDPVTIQSEDATSKTAFGERTWPSPPLFIPDTDEAQNWCDFNLAIYKDPIPKLPMTVIASRDSAHRAQALTRDISDRITVVANNGANFGHSGIDCFIEWERHEVSRVNEIHKVTWGLSGAEAFSDWFVWGTSKWGTTTRWAY